VRATVIRYGYHYKLLRVELSSRTSERRAAAATVAGLRGRRGPGDSPPVSEHPGRAVADGEDQEALLDSMILCKFVRGCFADFYAEAAAIFNARAELDPMIDGYYRARGWMPDGLIPEAKLRELGLGDLERAQMEAPLLH
jgi:hypothetical protein